MDERPRVRRISCAEVVAALLVMAVWSAVFLAVAAVGITYYRNPAQLGIIAPSAELAARAPAREEPTRASAVGPARVGPSSTPAPRLVTKLAALVPATATDTSTAPAFTASPTAQPTASPTASDTATSTPVPTKRPTSTATRVLKPEPSPSPEPTRTPIPTAPPSPTPPPAQDGGAPAAGLVLATRLDNPRAALTGQQPRGANPSEGPYPTPPLVAFTADTGPLMAPPPPAGDPPTRIVVPKIKLDSKIVPVGWRIVQESGHPVSLWDVADYAAGWHRGSAFPGNNGNLVISGHHNIKGEVFRYIVDLEVGDEIDVFVATQRYSYVVAEKHILREKGMPEDVRNANARWISQTTDQRLTLVTCWPYTNNTHRLIVVAKPMWK